MLVYREPVEERSEFVAGEREATEKAERERVAREEEEVTEKAERDRVARKMDAAEKAERVNATQLCQRLERTLKIVWIRSLRDVNT